MNRDKIVDLCLDGLLTDGGHHKQYYLEQILRLAAGDDLNKILVSQNCCFEDEEESLPGRLINSGEYYSIERGIPA